MRIRALLVLLVLSVLGNACRGEQEGASVKRLTGENQKLRVELSQIKGEVQGWRVAARPALDSYPGWTKEFEKRNPLPSDLKIALDPCNFKTYADGHRRRCSNPSRPIRIILAPER